MRPKVIETPDAPKAIGPYSQAIRAGNTVYLSGQIGLDPATGQLVEGTEAQAHHVLQNLRAVARAAGGDLDDIVKLTLLLADLADFAQGQRDHGAVLQAAVPGARDLPGGGAAQGRRALEIEGVLVLEYAAAIADATVPAWPARKAPSAPTPEARRGARRPARAARHRARRGSRPASAAALRGSHARRAARGACTRASSSRPKARSSRTDIQYRPRRQLVCLIEDGADDAARARSSCCASSISIPNQQKALAPGRRVRVFGEVRDGHFGREIVHPQFKVVEPEGAPLPDRLTPVYPTTAGLAQETLRKVVARALASDPALTAETLPDWLVARRHLWKFGDAVRFLHAPPPRLTPLDAARARRAHASGVDAPQVRRAPRAAALAQGAPQGARRAARAGADGHAAR